MSSSVGGGNGFPAHLRAQMDSVARTPGNSTARLVEAAAELERRGVGADEAVARVFGRFPVGGPATYGHDWWYPRQGPGWRLHQGTDIFADHGTPVRAPADGTVSISSGGLGGLSVRVTEPDGTYWYLAHLSAVPLGLHPGERVAAGQVVGYVGDSGNARGGPPHLHLELHPGGGSAVDPKEVLDDILREAESLLDGVLAAAGPVVGDGVADTAGGRRASGRIVAPVDLQRRSTTPSDAAPFGPAVVASTSLWSTGAVRPAPPVRIDPTLLVLAACLAGAGLELLWLRRSSSPGDTVARRAEVP